MGRADHRAQRAPRARDAAAAARKELGLNAAELVAVVAASRPQAIELAEIVSFAALVDRALLRQARLHLVPNADAGAEADLWLSPLVKSRSIEGITFTSEVASELRRRLAADATRKDAAWKLTADMHAHLPPTLKLEEMINHLSIDDSEEAARQIDDLLSSVLAAMAAGGRDGLASWAARAMASLPTSVRKRSTARMVAAGASLRLGVDVRQTIGGEEIPEWLRFVTPAQLATEAVGVQLAPGVLRVDATKDPGGQLLRLPATRPYLLDVSWTANGQPERRQLALRAGDVRNFEVGAAEVRLRTVTGEQYELRLGGTAPPDVRQHIIDFSDVLRRAGEWKTNFAPDLAADAPSLTLLIGPPGSGKTTTLAQFIGIKQREGAACAYHFFESGTPRLEYFGFAERSMIAQLMARYDAPPWAVTMHLDEFLRTIADKVGSGPVYIVMDNVDVVQMGYSVGAVLQPLTKLPPQFVIVGSATTSTRLDVNPRVVHIRELKELRLPFGALPAKGSSARRFIDALAVARAPLPMEDADALRGSVDLATLGAKPWLVERPHLGQPSVTITEQSVRSEITAQMSPEEQTAAHNELLKAIVRDDQPPEKQTWYAIRHAAWHMMQAGNAPAAAKRLRTPAVLRRSIELFGAAITADILDEVRDAAIRRDDSA